MAVLLLFHSVISRSQQGTKAEKSDEKNVKVIVMKLLPERIKKERRGEDNVKQIYKDKIDHSCKDKFLRVFKIEVVLVLILKMEEGNPHSENVALFASSLLNIAVERLQRHHHHHLLLSSSGKDNHTKTGLRR